MTCLWKFEAVIRSSAAVFYLDEQIPFFGDYRQAKVQAEERKRRRERRCGQLIDHVEPSLRIRPDQRQIPASLLKLAGYAMVSVAALVCADGHSSHTFIVLEKAGARQSETIQSRNWKAAGNVVKAYLADAQQRGVWFDILREGFCRHPEARAQWDRIKQLSTKA